MDAISSQRDEIVPTNGLSADGEIVWSWPPGAEAKFAMFMTSIAGDGGKKAGPRGDHV
jgi:hypothetical protein